MSKIETETDITNDQKKEKLSENNRNIEIKQELIEKKRKEDQRTQFPILEMMKIHFSHTHPQIVSFHPKYPSVFIGRFIHFLNFSYIPYQKFNKNLPIFT